MAEGVAAAAAAPPPPPPPPLLLAVPASLYVGDLDEAVDGADLIRAFLPFGPISSVRVCRDSTGVSLGYAYVNFYDRSYAEEALKLLNHTPLRGKPMRVMWSQRNPLSRKSGEANLFVKRATEMAEGVAAAAAAPPPPPLLPAVPASLYVGDLDEAVDGGDLIRAFLPFGPIISVRVCRDSSTGVSLGYAYVNFFDRSYAEEALKRLNHTPLRGKPMRVMWSQRNPLSRKSGEANLFVKNLDASVDGAKLEEMFGKYGVVLSCKVVTEGNGRSKGFGFVQFDAEESAEAAIKALHGSAGHGNKALYVAKFVKKSERQEPNSRGHADNESKQARDMLIAPLQGKLITVNCYSPLLNKFKTSREDDGHVADKNGLLHVTGAAGCTDASSHASANRSEGKSC